MDIQDLRIFCRLAAVGNLSAVGTEFKLTAGTISKRLQGMESELRVRLFARTTRSIRITQEGEIFHQRAQRILEEFDTGVAAIGDQTVSPRGRIRIASPAYLGGRHVGKALSAFLAAFPDIDVELELMDRPVKLQDDGFDVAITSGILADSAMKARRLVSDPQVIVASPGYIARHGKPKKPQDLECHSCLVLGEAWLWPFERNGKTEAVRIAGRLSANDCETLLDAAIAGLGIARLSAARAAAEIEAGRLCGILGGYDTSGDSTLWAVYPTATHMPARLRAFLDFMSDWFAGKAGQQANAIQLQSPGPLERSGAITIRETSAAPITARP